MRMFYFISVKTHCIEKENISRALLYRDFFLKLSCHHTESDMAREGIISLKS